MRVEESVALAFAITRSARAAAGMTSMDATASYAAKDALDTLLSVQALLLAASTLAGTIGHERKQRIAPKSSLAYNVARGLVLVMLFVAFGGVAAWITVFVSDHNLGHLGTVAEGVALLIPLVAIPMVGAVAAYWAKPS